MERDPGGAALFEKLGESVTIAGLSIVVELSGDGDVLLEVETPETDATLLEQFARFHSVNPDVFDQFLEQCRNEKEQGHRPEARQILAQIRKERRLKYGRGFLPLNNQYSGYYAALARGARVWVASDTSTEQVVAAINQLTQK